MSKKDATTERYRIGSGAVSRWARAGQAGRLSIRPCHRGHGLSERLGRPLGREHFCCWRAAGVVFMQPLIATGGQAPGR